MTEPGGGGPPARVSAALAALLDRVVDYAGLFPPAKLKMPEAIQKYAEYHAGPDAWMLGRFVLPASRLEEFEHVGGNLMPRTAADSWALSAVLSRDVEREAEYVDRFNDRHQDARRGAVHVDTVETRPAGPDEIVANDAFIGGYEVFVELPVTEDPAPLIKTLASVGACAKIRTGGITPDATPAVSDVVRFMRRCLERRLSFKATAGLHHPLRDEYPLTYELGALEGTQFGFLNVLVCAMLMGRRIGLDDERAAQLLEERDPESFRMVGDVLDWRGDRIEAEEIETLRGTMTSFGSCSFREPVSGLRRLGLL